MTFPDLAWTIATGIAFGSVLVLDEPHDWLVMAIYSVFGFIYLCGE